MEIYRWQNEQGRWFLHEDPHHSWSQTTQALRTLEPLSGVRVTKTKHFGASLNQFLQILQRRQFCLRRTLEEVTAAIDSTEAGPTVEEECLVQKLAGESG